MTCVHGTRVNAPRSLSLRSNFLWTLGGTVVYAVCQWLMLIVLAKFGSREIVGLFSYSLAATAPPMLMSNMQLRTIQAGDSIGRFSFEDYFGVRLVATATALLFILAAALSSGPPNSAGVVIGLGLAKGFESMSDVTFGGLQRHERMEIVARSLIAKGLLSVTALYLGLLMWGDLVSGVVLLALAWAGVLLFYDLPKLRSVLLNAGGSERVGIRLDRARSLVTMAIPLGIVMLLVSLSSSVPRYFIEHNLGLAQLGVFSAVSYLLAAGLTVLSALGHSVTPRLARSFENADWASFFRLLMLLLGFSSAMGLGGLLVAIAGGRTLLQKIYRPEYGDAHALLIWTMGVAWIAYVGSALGYAVTAARSFRGQPYACGAMLAATIAGCWVLIPSYQLVGAAASIGIGFLVQAVAWGLLLVKAVSSRRALA